MKIIAIDAAGRYRVEMPNAKDAKAIPSILAFQKMYDLCGDPDGLKNGFASRCSR